MQGTNDSVVITLLSDLVIDSVPFKSVQLDPNQIRKITQQTEANSAPTAVFISLF